MKKAMIFAIVVVFAFAMGMFMVTSSDAATIVGTDHDISIGDVTGSGTNQVCVFCHHPHKSVAGITDEVLWNMTDPTGTITVNLAGVDLDGSSVEEMRSYLCMACHDGVIAVGSLVAIPGDGIQIDTEVTLTGGVLGSLLNDHPVNVELPINSGYVVAATVTATLPLFTGTQTNTVQCGSCHDVHEGAVQEGRSFMRMAAWATDSAMCVVCHVK